MLNRLVLNLILYLLVTVTSMPTIADSKLIITERTPTILENNKLNSREKTNISDRSIYGPAKPNETTWSIANSLRPKGASVEQMLLALKNINPDAFIDGNLNFLKKNAILKIPNSEEIFQISKESAVIIFREQQLKWESQKEQIRREQNSLKSKNITNTESIEKEFVTIDSTTPLRENNISLQKEMDKDISGRKEVIDKEDIYSEAFKDSKNQIEASIKNEKVNSQKFESFSQNAEELSSVENLKEKIPLDEKNSINNEIGLTKKNKEKPNNEFLNNKSRNEIKEPIKQNNKKENENEKIKPKNIYQIFDEIKDRYNILNKNVPQWPLIIASILIILILVKSSKRGKTNVSKNELSSNKIKKRMNPYLNYQTENYKQKVIEKNIDTEGFKSNYGYQSDENRIHSPRAIFNELISLHKQLEDIQSLINNQGNQLEKLQSNIKNRDIQTILEGELKAKGLLSDSSSSQSPRENGTSNSIPQEQNSADSHKDNMARMRLEKKFEELEKQIEANNEQFYQDEPLNILVADLGSSDENITEKNLDISSLNNKEFALDAPINLDETFNDENLDQYQTSDVSKNNPINESKIELAKIYIEMGDVDGARGILKGLLEEGSDEEKQKANSLLKSI